MGLRILNGAGLECHTRIGIVVTVSVSPRGAQVISNLEAFICADAEIHLVPGADELVKVIGHDDAALGLAVGRSKTVQRYTAEPGRFALLERNGQVTGNNVRTAQLGLGDAGFLLHFNDANVTQLKVRSAGRTDRSCLSAEQLVMVGIFHGPDDFVTLAFFEVAAMDINGINRSGVARLVRAVPAGGDKMIAGNMICGDETGAIDIRRSWSVADSESRIRRRLRLLCSSYGTSGDCK